MPMYDHRVFRHDRDWWIAQVHSAVGGGWGEGPYPTKREKVFFTSITDEGSSTQTADIPPGKLTQMSHRSLVQILANAKPLDTRMEMYPYNAPPSEFPENEVIKDEEDLRWIIRRGRGLVEMREQVLTRPSIELVCLDDSALRSDVLLGENISSTEIFTLADERALIKAVKDRFDEVAVDTSDWVP